MFLSKYGCVFSKYFPPYRVCGPFTPICPLLSWDAQPASPSEVLFHFPWSPCVGQRPFLPPALGEDWSLMCFLVYFILLLLFLFFLFCMFIQFSLDLNNIMSIHFYFVFWKCCYALRICFLFSRKSLFSISQVDFWNTDNTTKQCYNSRLILK